MEETLKTVRFLHRAAVALSAVLFISALSPRLYQRYKDALEEVRQLQKLHAEGTFRKCTEYMRNHVPQRPLRRVLPSSYFDALRLRFGPGGVGDIRSASETSTKPSPNSPTDEHLSGASALLGLLCGVRVVGDTVGSACETFTAPSPNSTIDEHWKFLATPPLAMALVPDANQIGSILASAVQQAESKWRKAYGQDSGIDVNPLSLRSRGFGLYLHKADQLLFTIEEDEQGLVACWRIQNVRVWGEDEASDANGKYLQKWKQEVNDITSWHSRAVVGEHRLDSGWKPVMWQYDFPPSRPLHVGFAGYSGTLLASDTPLRALREVWPQVSNKSLLQARDYLEEQVAEREDEVSVLGLSIRESILTWLGPALVSFVLAYLYGHLKHAQRAMNGHEVLMRAYPWISLYEDTISRGLTFLSIVVLPLLATGYLTVVTWDIKDVPSYVATVLTVGTLICGYRVHRICVDLREGLSDEGVEGTSNEHERNLEE